MLSYCLAVLFNGKHVYGSQYDDSQSIGQTFYK